MSTNRPALSPARPCFEPLEPRLFLDAQVIAEVGQVAVNHRAEVVTLSRTYENPVVFATRQNARGSHPTMARVFNVKNNRFSVRLVEAPNCDGAHMEETVSYFVIEAGSWTLADGTRIEAGESVTAATVTAASGPRWRSVNFQQTFTAAPAVLTQVQTARDWAADHKFVNTRQRDKTAGGFRITMQHADSQTDPHGRETIGYLAVEAGSGDWSGHAFEAIATGRGTSNRWGQVSLGDGFSETPNVMAGLGSKYGADSAHLRMRSVDADSFNAQAREDTSVDAEVAHGRETVDVLAIQGVGQLAAEVDTSSPPVSQPNRTVFTGSRYTVSMVDVETFSGLTGFTVRVRNTTGLSGYNAGSFDGVYFGYSGISGQLHQHYAEGLSPTSPTTDGAYATAIDTHFLAGSADMLVVANPSEDVGASASSVATDAASPFDQFASTSFGTNLTGVFAVDAQATWRMARVVAATGSQVRFDFFVSGTAGGEVISATFTA